MKNIKACILCGSKRYEIFGITKGCTGLMYFIVRCPECGSLFLPGKFDSMEHNPDMGYVTVSKSSDRGRHIPRNKRYVLYNRDRRKAFRVYSDFIKRNKPSGKILDVGCGDGYFLTFFSRDKYERYGVEFNKNNYNRCLKNKLENVFYGRFRSFRTKKKFDVIVMLLYIAHSESSLANLRKCYRLLKKGGIIFLETGNANSDVARRLGTNGVFFREAPAHRYFPSDETIVKMLERAGFSDAEILVPKTEDIISLWARKG
ncbi:MAG: class I SAM-dependent methyltransferase [Elusimicrobia bacterium]|nr:class I SAM-dependent methyltransferase [Elusimicrobiota bacterium]